MTTDDIFTLHANTLLNLMGREISIQRGNTSVYQGKAIFAPVSDDAIDGSVRKDNQYYLITIPANVQTQNRDSVIVGTKQFVVAPDTYVSLGKDGFDKLKTIRIMYLKEVGNE